MTTVDGPGLRHELAKIVERASDGDVSATDALVAGASLHALGFTSLGYLRLMDEVEMRYGMALDLGAGGAQLDTVDGIAARLAGGEQ
jgi:acyl carrier protein